MTDEEIHAGYDALLDAWVAAREAAEAGAYMNRPAKTMSLWT